MKVEEPSDEKIKEYEAVVELANQTKEPLSEQSIRKIEELISDLDCNEDPVYQVNCLQLVADLACSRQALSILESKCIPDKLIKILEDSDPLIVPHSLKFFYRVDPSDLETKYPRVLDKICDYCQSDDRQLLDYAVDIIAAIGRGGHSARKILANHARFREGCLSKLGSALISSDSLIKSRTLRCIADLIEYHEEDPKDESSELSRTFYFDIIPGEHRMTNQLLALCRVPFPEIRISSMLVVSLMAVHLWGQRELAEHPNFLTWILDRSTETCKEAKEAKFEILRTLVKSRTTVRVFTGEDYMKMRSDFKNGPFHVGIAEEMLVDNQQA